MIGYNKVRVQRKEVISKINCNSENVPAYLIM